ncbi:uncharacterized protein DFL_009041 [Arthrobotrys flagrans]|uniref:Uncharacterized protein n=1 Tax=Arthrobotrys flagrans TaxID=97331 RepID=A0A436ZQS2_ARTFL|nr:hypothetical protein DFL_009041 [Arthrobotrys flagrans]
MEASTNPSPAGTPAPEEREKQYQDAFAWDLDRESDLNQPWRAYWPPQNIEAFTEEELKERPWLTWTRDPNKPNDKPWYQWVNDFGRMTAIECSSDCPNCGGRGCHVCSTAAEGG